MNKKICLITGASGGIGRETALLLAKADHHVILVCRNAAKAEQVTDELRSLTHSSSIDFLIADLSSQADIHALAQTLYEKYPRLDVLINNAGSVVSPKTLSVDHIELTLATNHLGPFLLTNLLIDLLKKSEQARIINVSSAIHKWASLDINDLQYDRRKYQCMKAYAQSKLLMNITSFELSRRLADTNIIVNCIHPGAVKTHLGSNNANNFLLRSLDKLIKAFFISPEAAAKSIVLLAISPQYASVTGKYFEKGKQVSTSTASRDKVLAKEVWARSELLTSNTG